MNCFKKCTVFLLLLSSLLFVLPASDVKNMLNQMSLDDKIGQMMMLNLPECATDELRTEIAVDLVRKYRPGGMIFFVKDLHTDEQIIRMNSEMQKNSQIPLFIAIDQEGGRVTRLPSETKMPGNMAVGATSNPAFALESGKIIGRELRSLGFNLNFAPDLDVNNNPENPVICERSFGENPDKVSLMGVKYIEGLHESEIISTAKHFPGHGDTSVDSHLDLPCIKHSRERVDRIELKPFQTAVKNGVDMVMTAHVTFPSLDSSLYISKKTGEKISLPATLSEKIISGLLRKEMGFDGVVVTDAFNMKAIADHFGYSDAVVMAVKAGADIVLMPEKPDVAIEAIRKEVESGRISKERIDQSVARILSLKNRFRLQEKIKDISDVRLANIKARNTIRSATHLASEKLIARKAVCLIRNENQAFPFKPAGKFRLSLVLTDDRISDVMKKAAEETLKKVHPDFQIQTFSIMNPSFSSEMLENMLKNSDAVILGTFNLGRGSSAEKTISRAKETITAVSGNRIPLIMLAVRSPYDPMYLPEVKSAVAVFGSEKGYSNVVSGMEAIFGVFSPTGVLPVTIPAEHKTAASAPAAPLSKEKTEIKTVEKPALEKVKLGIDNLDQYLNLFSGKRVGLVTNQSGINSDIESSIDVLFQKVKLTALFAPEHGIRGCAQAGDTIGNEKDVRTGLPVHSLYGESKKPTPEMLYDVDILAYDIQDVGARFYTYINTMAYCMEACAEQGKEFVVFDRPNPVSGVIQGIRLDEKFKSFIGMYPIPQRYGMTAGEFAQYINKEFNINCRLSVVPLTGWKRTMYYDETGLHTWVMPSPNMPAVDTAVVYTGTCIFEGTNVSEGRGTTRPFEQIGAPFIKGLDLSDRLNSLKLPGVRFRAASFKPSFSKFQGENCQGVALHITDRNLFNSVKTGFAMLYTVKDMYQNDFKYFENNFIDKLSGGSYIREAEYSLSELFALIDAETEEFRKTAAPYLIYQ